MRAESPTKAWQEGLGVQPRPVLPKMFATGESRCPVALCKNYLSKKPVVFKSSGSILSMHRQPHHNRRKIQEGKNTISKLSMKEIIASQHMCPEKRLSNHSVRKTVIRKLKAAREFQNLKL